MNRKERSTLYSFACECGKAYDSYPALYLHFKRTHKIKITTKISGVCSQTMKKKGKEHLPIFTQITRISLYKLESIRLRQRIKCKLYLNNFGKNVRIVNKNGEIGEIILGFFGYINCNELTITE